MSGEMTLRMLWLDNDGPGRFQFERRQIQRRGWDVIWSYTIRDAAERLVAEPVDAIILDQMVPYDGSPAAGWVPDGPPKVWGGCVLLWWLRGKGAPTGMPGNREVSKKPYLKSPPHSKNSQTPVAIASGYYNHSVEDALRNASPLDSNLRILVKPLDLQALLGFLHSCSEIAAKANR